ncbi:putative pantothenate kinase, partial [Teladorsagia circumcincta]
NWHDRVPDDVIHCTGGGSYKYAEMMHNFLGVQYQYKPITADLIYPFLLVNIGTGISILKVDSPTQFQRVGGSSMGGGAFIGLGNLLTQAQSFDELLLMAEKGDHRRCDTLVCDIYGGSYDNLNLPADLIAGSFGKCSRIGKRNARGDHEQVSQQDIAKSLLLMISNNIGQMAMLYGMRFTLKRIYFGGFFIRKHPITMRTLSYAINYWSKVCDIYGGSYDNLNLPADLIAGSFGKCSRIGKRNARGDHEQVSQQDIAKSLLLMISNNIGQMAMLYGMRFTLKRIYFGGFFIRKHPITMRTLSYAINYWSKGNMEALFMKHEGYLGAVGAFLDTPDS